jgi:D-serine deaminase-like pyridoxal phosphate-dependent protein
VSRGDERLEPAAEEAAGARDDVAAVSRRHFLAAGAAVAGAAAAGPLADEAAAAKRRKAAKRCGTWRPRRGERALPALGDGGAPTPPARLAELAKEIGGGDALTFLDLAAFDANLAAVTDVARQEGWAIRPALKSFQSAGFVAYALSRLPEPRGMVFHLRVVDELLAVAPPDTDLLMGYPPSPPELERFLATKPPRTPHRMRILVDSLELLEHAARLAPAARRPFEIALQLESGFELSGLRTPQELTQALAIIRDNRLSLSAVMCYDGHAAFRPERSFRQTVKDDAQRRFAAWNEQLRAEGVDPDSIVRNGPASSTYKLWRGAKEPNEISPGAGLLFHGYITEDGHDNDGLQPTLHHAAPVHRITAPRVPITGAPDAQAQGRDGISIKGGAWPNNSGSLSSPVHPPGLENDELSGGGGNNQSNFYAPKGSLRRGDYVVLRPKHAGDAIDYFHALVAVRDGSVRRVWPTLARPAAHVRL